MNSASTQQCLICSHIRLTRHHHDHVLSLLEMASTAKKVNNAGVMFQLWWNHVNCAHWSITVHAFIHQTCMATSRQKTNKSDIIWLNTFFTHPPKKLKSFLTMAMHGTSSKHGIPWTHITWWHLVENSPSILHAPTFCIHVNQASRHKNIWIPSIFNDLLVCAPALFQCNYAGTCIQHSHISNRVWAHTFLLHLLK